MDVAAEIIVEVYIIHFILEMNWSAEAEPQRCYCKFMSGCCVLEGDVHLPGMYTMMVYMCTHGGGYTCSMFDVCVGDAGVR